MYTYYTKGVCSSRMDIELDGDKIKAVRIAGGCNGNLQGIIRLVEGMDGCKRGDWEASGNPLRP